MEIRDAIRIAGSTAMELFPWGKAVINLANGFLPAEYQLTDRSSGTDLYNVVKELPPEVQAVLMSRQIDLAIAESDNERDKVIAREQADVTGKTARPTVALMLTGMVVAVAVLLAIAYTSIARQTGAMPDTGLLESILKLAGEILKSYFGSDGE